MFNKFQQGGQPDRFYKISGGYRSREKEFHEKLSRIAESYVDAAIRAVQQKTRGRREGSIGG
jgi:hypothetical protein